MVLLRPFRTPQITPRVRVPQAMCITAHVFLIDTHKQQSKNNTHRQPSHHKAGVSHTCYIIVITRQQTAGSWNIQLTTLGPECWLPFLEDIKVSTAVSKFRIQEIFVFQSYWHRYEFPAITCTQVFDFLQLYTCCFNISLLQHNGHSIIQHGTVKIENSTTYPQGKS